MDNVQKPHLTVVGGTATVEPTTSARRTTNYPARVQSLTTYLEAIGMAVEHMRGETDPDELWVYLDVIGLAVTEALESAS